MEALYDDNRAPGGAAHGYAGHAARLDLPRTGPSGCPSVYSVVYGNVGILSLDANDLSTEIPTNAGYSGGAQMTLAHPAARASCAPTRRSTSSSRSSTTAPTRPAAPTPPTRGVRAALAPLFDRFSVDLVVQGHNHQYERTDPIRGGVATVRRPTAPASSPRATAPPTSAAAPAGGPATRGSPARPTATAAPPAPAASPWSRATSPGRTAPRPPRPSTGPQPATSTTRSSPCTSRPRRRAARATMSVRAVTDGGHEIDRVDLVRAPPPARALATPSSWTRRASGLSVPGHVTV